MDKSVHRVTVWHHSAEPRDAKQCPLGQICPSVPYTHVRFLYYHLHIVEGVLNGLRTLRLIREFFKLSASTFEHAYFSSFTVCLSNCIFLWNYCQLEVL